MFIDSMCFFGWNLKCCSSSRKSPVVLGVGMVFPRGMAAKTHKKNNLNTLCNKNRMVFGGFGMHRFCEVSNRGILVFVLARLRDCF